MSWKLFFSSPRRVGKPTLKNLKRFPVKLNGLSSTKSKNFLFYSTKLKGSEAFCIYREPRKRKVGNVLVTPWQNALEALGL